MDHCFPRSQDYSTLTKTIKAESSRTCVRSDGHAMFADWPVQMATKMADGPGMSVTPYCPHQLITAQLLWPPERCLARPDVPPHRPRRPLSTGTPPARAQRLRCRRRRAVFPAVHGAAAAGAPQHAGPGAAEWSPAEPAGAAAARAAAAPERGLGGLQGGACLRRRLQVRKTPSRPRS